MIPIASSVVLSLLLAMLFWREWHKTTVEPELPFETNARGEADEENPICPREIVLTIFCRDDWDFVAKLNSPRLKAQFQRERKFVAQTWVRGTAAAIRRIMREHAKASRSSSDLQIDTEVKIYLSFAVLQMACGLLFLLIAWGGPICARQLSLYVYGLAEGLGHTHEVLTAAMARNELSTIRRS